MRILLWTMLFVSILFPLAGAQYRIEAENLPDLGKWQVQKYGATSGNNILVGAGKGADNVASGEYIVENGTYWIWGRVLSFGQQSRRGELWANGTKIGFFGDDPLAADAKSPSWIWVKLPVSVNVTDGKITLQLKAISEYVRSDVFLLTTDPDFTPPESLPEIGKIPLALVGQKITANVVQGGTPPKVAAGAQCRIEAEDLPNIGKWQVQKYGATSGNSILVGAVKGADNVASGEYIVANGTYWIWGRVLSFGQQSRRGELWVNGAKIGFLGDDPLAADAKSPSWIWVKLPVPVNITDGKIMLQFKAISEYVRCDALILSTDPDFIPPESLSEIGKIPLAQTGRQNVVNIHERSKLEGIFPRPLPAGNGPDILLFNGGRPWVGNETAAFFNAAGARCLVLNSVYLAGEGGASIKIFMTDKEEPEAFDGVTPALDELNNYKLLIVNAIPEENQKNIFTPERIAKIREYVRNGGSLLLTVNTPPAFGDLLPVKLGPKINPAENLTADFLDAAAFRDIPGAVPIVESYRKAELQPNAQALAIIQDSAKNIFMATRQYGKGRVLFANVEQGRRSGIRQFYNWAFNRAFMIAAANVSAGLNLDVKSGIFPVESSPAPQQLGAQKLTVKSAEMSLADNIAPVRIDGRKVSFENGFYLEVQSDGNVAVYRPGRTDVFLQIPAPVITVREKQTIHESDTAEAVDVMRDAKNQKINWQFDSISGDKTVKILYKSPEGFTAFSEFKSAELRLNQRLFHTLALRTVVEKVPTLVSEIRFAKQLFEPLQNARRMSCYMPPRGYADFDMTKNSNTSRFSFFGDAQPFGYIAGSQGIYTEFVEKPSSVSVQYLSQAGRDFIEANHQTFVGRLETPITTEYFHFGWSDGAEDGVNDYLALWQFQRLNLRKAAGLKNFTAVPLASATNMCTSEEKKSAIAAAAKLGFRYFHLNYCPTDIEDLISENNLKDYETCRANNLYAFPWTPGDYCHSSTQKMGSKHPDWLMKGENGKIYQYFGKFPVFDVNHPEFQAWYFSVAEKMQAAGVGAVYLDMGGTAADNVNFSPATAPNGLASLIEMYRFWQQRNVLVSIEGMSPLIVDNYWYRKNLYNSFKGKEFAFLGTQIRTNIGDDLSLDPFLLAMYGAFTIIHTDGYALNFERTPGEIAMTERVSRLLPDIHAALDLTKMPFIQETPFGTVWTGENGGALFFRDHVESLELTLPENWQIRGVQGNVLKNVHPQTIVILEKKSTKERK